MGRTALKRTKKTKQTMANTRTLIIYGIPLIWCISMCAVTAVPVCDDNHFWFSITGACEPCSRICDPPGRHETDCPSLCPFYKGPSTTTLSTTTELLPQALALKQSKPNESDSGISHKTWQIVVVVVVSTVVGVVVINIVIGFALYKKRESLKKCWPASILGRCLCKKNYTRPVQVEDDTDNSESQQTSADVTDHLIHEEEGKEENEHGSGTFRDHERT